MEPDALHLSLLVAGVLAALAAWRLGRRSAVLGGEAALAQERARLVEEQRLALSRIETEHAELLRRSREAFESALREERSGFEQRRQELAGEEQRLVRREAQLAEREGAVAERDRAVLRKLEALDERDARQRQREEQWQKREEAAQAREARLGEAEARVEVRLSEVAGLTPADARQLILDRLETELAAAQSTRIAKHEKDLALRLREVAVETVSRAIQRYAAEHTAETTTAKIRLGSEDAKGRIIGREGRNIKAFELASGVDVIIDEDPDAIAVSCFDPVRREIARRALVVLLEDGRIHPARIEEVLVRVRQELDREIAKLGEDAAFSCEVSGLHPQILRLLGKLHFRSSYGQNVLAHSREVALLCAAMASDLGLDPKLARRCGLLHDVGKAIDHEQEGSHPQLGYEALKRHGENEIVANAALAHHEGEKPITPYTVLAAAADAISAARPGARTQSSENFLKRLAQFETIALGRRGVQKAYAIQAGRELRVIVNALAMPDSEMAKAAHDIARAIEEQVAYPGEVRVTLIREMRAVSVAR